MIIDNNTSDVKTLIEKTIEHAKNAEDEIAITNLRTGSDGSKLCVMCMASEYALKFIYYKPNRGQIDLAQFRYDFWDIAWITELIEDVIKYNF